MWHKLIIGEETYIIVCTIDAASNVVKCVLYDSNEKSWSEEQNFSIIFKRVKQLNKRILFDEVTVSNTLLRLEPIEVNFTDDGDGVERNLKVKYRLGARPFNFEWHLQKSQKRNELQTALLFSLFDTVKGMTAQIEKLRETVEKKDAEIGQYKREGAVLRITTVATKLFDFEEFDNTYAATNDLNKSFQNIGDFLQQNFLKNEAKQCNNKSESKISVEQVKRVNTRSVQQEASPRNRKRKALEMQKQQLARRLNAHKRKIEYEDSQSLSQELENTSECVHIKSNSVIKQEQAEESVMESGASTSSAMSPKRQNALRSTTKTSNKNTRNKYPPKNTPKKLEYINSDSASDSESESNRESPTADESVKESGVSTSNDIEKKLAEIQKVFDNLKSYK